MTKQVKIAILSLFLLSVILSGLNFLWTSGQVNAANARAQAQCQVAVDLSGAPIIMPKAVPKEPPLGVKIISDFRVAWHRAGCSGELDTPDPTFVRWAHYYHLPEG